MQAEAMGLPRDTIMLQLVCDGATRVRGEDPLPQGLSASSSSTQSSPTGPASGTGQGGWSWTKGWRGSSSTSSSGKEPSAGPSLGISTSTTSAGLPAVQDAEGKSSLASQPAGSGVTPDSVFPLPKPSVKIVTFSTMPMGHANYALTWGTMSAAMAWLAHKRLNGAGRRFR